MNYPSIPNEVNMLRMYKAKNDYTSAQVAELLTAFGWTWWEDHVDDLLKGKAKVTTNEKVFLRLFLLDKFHDYNSS